MTTILPSQVRAARALLRMKQVDLAIAAGVSDVTIKNFERGATPNPHDVTLIAIRTALENAGVIFTPENGEGPGVKLRKGKR